MSAQDKIDWSECAFVEGRLGVQSGAPVVLGTRMPVSAIVDNFDYGVSIPEIAEQFELPPDRVKAVVGCAESHRITYLLDTHIVDRHVLGLGKNCTPGSIPGGLDATARKGHDPGTLGALNQRKLK